MIPGEGAVETNLDQPHFFAPGAEIIDSLFNGVGARAHADDNILGVGSSNVIKKPVTAAGKPVDGIHRFFHYPRHSQVEGVGRLAVLEVDIRVLGGPALMGLLGVERSLPEGSDRCPINKLLDILVIDHFYFLHLVGSAETVEKVQKGDPRLDCAEVSHQSQIHDLLHRGRGQQGKARLPGGHYVGMISENGKRMSRQGARRNMKNRG